MSLSNTQTKQLHELIQRSRIQNLESDAFDKRISIERHEFNLRRMRRWGKEIKRSQNSDPHLVVEPALTPRDFADSMRLVHDTYVGAGYMHPTQHGLRIRRHDTSSGMTTFVGRDLNHHGKIVGTVSIISNSPMGLPSEEVFPREIEYVREQSKYSCEITGLAINPDYRHTKLCFELTRSSVGWVAFAESDSCFIAVSPSTQNFFREVLLFDLIGSQRSSSPSINDPVVGLWSNPQESRIRAQEIDKILGADEFLGDYIYNRNPIQNYLQHPGIESIVSAYNRILTNAMILYLTKSPTKQEMEYV